MFAIQFEHFIFSKAASYSALDRHTGGWSVLRSYFQLRDSVKPFLSFGHTQSGGRWRTGEYDLLIAFGRATATCTQPRQEGYRERRNDAPLACALSLIGMIADGTRKVKASPIVLKPYAQPPPVNTTCSEFLAAILKKNRSGEIAFNVKPSNSEWFESMRLLEMNIVEAAEHTAPKFLGLSKC